MVVRRSRTLMRGTPYVPSLWYGVVVCSGDSPSALCYKICAAADLRSTLQGASSGIGLATLRRIIKHGGKVFACDVNPLPEPESSSVPFLKADVSSWKEQLDVFKATEKEYGKIDQVFANAGIGKSTTLLDDSVDENGDLLAPMLDTININLIGVIYTVKLAIHYIQKNPNGGSIVITASGSSFQRFPVEDYSTSYQVTSSLGTNTH
ncbi:hypothetical protein IG631_13890 [Alternaria alternata]|nr:hypothetical protein IG631_13890 [Alternaria alternata]